jgi:nucleoside-diphosphate kinase
MAVERTFFMVKPDGVKRYLSNLMLSKLIEAGFKVVARKRLTVTLAQAEQLYEVHKGKPFYDGLIKFITSGLAIPTIIEGENAVSRVREMMGATDPRKAAPGTFRGDNIGDPLFTADGTMMNICHGSDSIENAKKEMAIFFTDAEINK